MRSVRSGLSKSAFNVSRLAGRSSLSSTLPGGSSRSFRVLSPMARQLYAATNSFPNVSSYSTLAPESNAPSGINFLAEPFNFDTLQHRIRKFVTTTSEECGPLTDLQTIELLRAVTVEYGAYASRVLGHSDSEILNAQKALLEEVVSEQGLNRIILTPGTLKPVVLELVNKEWRTEELVKPGVKKGPWELKDEERSRKSSRPDENSSNNNQVDADGENATVQEHKESISTTNLVISLFKAYNQKYSNPVLAKRAQQLAVEQSSSTIGSKSSFPLYIPLDVAMIPFRRAVYGGELDKGFEIVDASAASRNYMTSVRSTWKKWIGWWGLGTGTTLLSVQGLLSSGLVGTWDSTGGVLAMVLAYIVNMTLLGGVAFAGRVSGVGEYVKWVPGTNTTYWYSHAAEMRMVSMIAAIDQALPENQNELSFRIKKLLQGRNMMAVEATQEEMMKEYWASGGEGFQWVEPEQDPAEILWRHKVEKTKAKRIEAQKKYGDKYNWADQVIHRKSLPHASTTEIPKYEPPAPKGLPEV